MTTAVATGAPVSPLAAAAAAAAMPRDAVIAWLRGEFAAANAIIDALCGHLAQIGGTDYDDVFAALHRRRLNWFPVLYMQKFYPVAEVTSELRRVAASHAAAMAEEEAAGVQELPQEVVVVVPEAEADADAGAEVVENGVHEDPIEEEESNGVNNVDANGELEGDGAAVGDQVADGEYSSGDSSDRKATEEDGAVDGGSQGEQGMLENYQICSDHDDCIARPDRIKILKGFVAKESVKGHMVNVVKGLKVYEDIFTASELIRLNEFINEFRQAGRNGELAGETFIFFNKEIKGNKREIIQLGVPLFQPTNEEASSSIEPIPLVLQAVIDHLVLWRLIPESRKPNSVIINFFDEDEYSQPYFKPPHLDNPISTLLLSETTMAFGRMLVTDHNGNYKGHLTLPLKEGSLLVIRGNSADMARHVVCPSSSRRVSITFVKVRPTNKQADVSALPSPTKAMTLWRQPAPPVQKVSASAMIGYAPQAVIASAWGMAVRTPLLMMAPTPRPMVMSSHKRIARSGTGVFLPWTVGPKRYNKHLPPRIQKRRFSALLSPIEAQG